MTGVCLTIQGTLTTAIHSDIILTQQMIEFDHLAGDSDSEIQCNPIVTCQNHWVNLEGGGRIHYDRCITTLYYLILLTSWLKWQSVQLYHKAYITVGSTNTRKRCLAIGYAMIYHLTFRLALSYVILGMHCKSYTWPKLCFKVVWYDFNVFFIFNCIICTYVNFSYIWMVLGKCINGLSIESSILLSMLLSRNEFISQTINQRYIVITYGGWEGQ